MSRARTPLVLRAMSPTVGSLFAGIGGFDLGLEAVGYRTAWAVEVADFPRQVLAARWPDVDLLADVREVKGPPRVDVLTGGFPCQDLSLAGHGAGIGGARSGLWGEYARIIGEVEPALVLIENVPALLRRGFEVVVRDLTALGYRVEWDCIPAAAFGAPHLRDRVWIAAHRQAAPAVFNAVVELSFFAERWADRLPAEGWARWPRSGFVDGEEIHPLEPMAPLGAVKGGAVLPTPMAADGSRMSEQGIRGTDNPTLLGAARRLPTPIARDWKGSGPDGQLGTVAAKGLWPTVVESDAKGSRRATARTDDWESNEGTTLLDAVSEAEGIVWPTPKASPSGPDFARAGREGSGGDDLATAAARDARRHGKGALNPDWVEWLMGFPLGWTDPVNDEPYAYPWTLGEPPGVPRVTTDNNRRNERLTALGNALVPPAAAWLGARARGMFPPTEENTGA